MTRKNVTRFNGSLLVCGGGAIKATGDGWVEGMALRFGNDGDTDVTRYKDFFTKSTDYDRDLENGARLSTFYHHGMDKTLGKKRLTYAELSVATAGKARDAGYSIKSASDDDQVGIWAKAQLDLSDAYQQRIYDQVLEGKQGFSTGSVAHLVVRESRDNGAHEVKFWPLAELSITPAPGEPRNVVQAVKFLDDLFDLPSGNNGDRRLTEGKSIADLLDAGLSALEAIKSREGEVKSDLSPAVAEAFRWRVERVKSLAAELVASMMPVGDAPNVSTALADILLLDADSAAVASRLR